MAYSFFNNFQKENNEFINKSKDYSVLRYQ